MTVVIVGLPMSNDYVDREITVENAPVLDARHPFMNPALRFLPRVLKNYDL